MISVSRALGTVVVTVHGDLDAHVLRHTLTDLRRIASAVRDRLSADTWRILSQLQEDFHLQHARIRFDDVLGILNRMITDLAAFSGMEMENMARGHGWRFLDVGRRLERSVNLTSLVRSALAAGCRLVTVEHALRILRGEEPNGEAA